MNRNFTLCTVFFTVVFSLTTANYVDAQTTYVDNGTANTYTLNSGDSLYVASGTYTGVINKFNLGAKITVAAGATFQPSSMAFPSVRGTMIVNGTFKISSLQTNSNFTLYNYGVVWVTGTTTLSGSTQMWTNYFGGLMKFDGAVNMTNDNAFLNMGLINYGNDLTMTGTTAITNKNMINIAGNYQNNGGVLTNEGKFQVTGSITFNNGQAIIYNHCRMIADGGIHNTTGQLFNYGFLWARAALGMGDLVNSGSIVNGPNARIKSVTFNNTGTVTGSGYLYFTGYTTTTNLGTTGVPGVTTDTIKFYDVSRTNIATIYDAQTGIVYPNTVYRVFPAPDTTATYFAGCSTEMISNIPLPIQWNYFYVNLSNNIPALNWSANQDPEATYIVERSYDGTNFYGIKNITAETNKSVYNYDDITVNTESGIVYYHIKAAEATGKIKYTETKTVKFSNKTGVTIQTAPNPFTSQFSINYQTTTKETLSIKVYSLTGQLQVSKINAVNSGYNSITVTEAATLAKGMYMVQVSNEKGIVATQKIIKQ